MNDINVPIHVGIIMDGNRRWAREKNKKTLENVKTWLKPGKNNINFDNILIIDDEADNATINTRDENNPTAINLGIRKLLKKYGSGYILLQLQL